MKTPYMKENALSLFAETTLQPDRNKIKNCKAQKATNFFEILKINQLSTIN